MKTIKEVVSAQYDYSATLLGKYIADAIKEQTGVVIKHLWCGYNKVHPAVYVDGNGNNRATTLDIRIRVHADQEVSAEVTSNERLFHGKVRIKFDESAKLMYDNVSHGANAYNYLSEKEARMTRDMNADY